MKKILLFIILIFSMFLASCSFERQEKSDFGLSRVKDASELKNLIKKSEPKQQIRWFWQTTKDGDAFTSENFDVTERDESSSNDYTKTNVQVEGVDEGDVVKTDGSRIYSISWDRLQVVNLLGNGEMELLLNKQLDNDYSKAEYNQHTYYSDLYVTDDYLVVIGQRYSYGYTWINKDIDTDPNENKILPWFLYYTTMSVVQIYDLETLEVVEEYEVSGNLLSSRLIDNQLYLISSHSIYSYQDFEDYDVRPWYKHNDDVNYFDYTDIKYIPNQAHRAFTVITNITIKKDNIKINNNVFLATNSWGQIYVSLNAIYFASSETEQNFFGNYIYKSSIVSFQFAKNTGEVFYGGYANYLGTVINQFAIDEYDGYLRIATTHGWGDTVVNRLYIFKRVLKDEEYVLEQVSLIDKGLGKPGERIQSVRFNKDIATIVTFLQTDPLYTIDLSDPTKPKIVGELEVPGFSTYQHPWTDTLIIGVGFEANNDGIVTGLKLSLYDISDTSNPIEVGKPLVFEYNNNGYAYTESTYNHKAVMIDKSRNVIGFSMTRYERTENYRFISEYIVFDVDETKEQPISIKHKISHNNYYDEQVNQYSRYYNYDIKRAFRVDDFLYVISNEVITSHNLINDLSTVDYIIFNRDQNN